MSDPTPFALKYLNGPEAGRLLLVSPPMRFGRHRDNEICISYDDRASRFHAEIRHTGDGHELADLGSTNGSIHRGEVLRDRARALGAGDTFQIGSTTFLFDHLSNLQPDDSAAISDGTAVIPTMKIEAESSALATRQTEAVLIADMRASTSLGGVLGESKMLRLKERLFDILQRAAHRHGTAFTKQTGDGYMMTFATLTQAIAATRAIIGETQRHNQRRDIVHPLHLRLSLTLGETLCDHMGDRHGQIVNLAFRLISLSSLPGEMPGDPDADLTTPLITTTMLASGVRQMPWEPMPPAPIDLPPQEIKGFPDPIEISIFQLRPDVGTTA
ncbi:adenylate/guanylate cyclase domain-containing protein [Candidatus Sumerlaeota bacterium]|nr:adenylate/guanylate cyclase domain-containing protein [Candidatus Sumerlaeota bacterium]